MGTLAKSSLTSDERTRQVASVLWVTLALNWSVAVLKILFGWTTHCMSITADGFHSLSDGTSNIIGLIGISVAGHPADKEHPYGHQKFETMASVVISALLLFAAFGIVQHAIHGLLRSQRPEVSPASFWVMGLTLLVNIAVVVYERAAARRLKSELLHSDSWHTLTDVFVTLGVILALIGIRLNFPLLDSIFSLGIAVLIGYAAFHILKRSSDILTDRAVLDPAFIESIVRRVGGVADCHEIRTRGNEHAIYVDLHVLVDPAMSVEASHRLASKIEHDIRSGIEGVQDVVVHIEPTTHDHSELTDR